MSSQQQHNKDSDLLDHLFKPQKSQWPPVFVFIALLVFIYKMTELFVR